MLNDFHDLFLTNDNYEINENNFKNVINLIDSKVDEETEPFLTFIKWCYKKRCTNLSEEEIRYVKDFCAKLNNEEKCKDKWDKLKKSTSLSVVFVPFGIGIGIPLKDLLKYF